MAREKRRRERKEERREPKSEKEGIKRRREEQLTPTHSSISKAWLMDMFLLH